jgi:hypothetical protein
MEPKINYSNSGLKVTSIKLILGRKPIYKFVKDEHMEQLFETGVIRLGTLHQFRKTEELGENQGDAAEGINAVVQKTGRLSSVEPGSFASKFLSLSGGTVDDCMLIEQRHSENGYIFCGSHTFTEHSLHEWAEKEGLTSCYEIFDPLGFQQAISRAIFDKGVFVKDAKIIYVDGDIDSESALRHVAPTFIKQRRYEWQTEYRWAWELRKGNTDPTPEFISIPNAHRYCRRLARLQDGRVEYFPR